ncbi:MAG: HAD family hydrolase [Myxococcota bacterium]
MIFDFDGTLVDTLGDIAAALSAARVDLGGNPVDAGTVRGWIGEGLDHLIQEALPKGAQHADLKRRYRERYATMMFDTSKPYEGVGAMLDALGPRPLAVASNKSERFVTQMLEHFGMLARFEVAIGGDTFAFKKPSPDVIAHLVGGRSFGKVWMVGDSAVDVMTGKAYGARTIGCTYGIRGRDELEQAGADHLVGHPREIAETILTG